LETLERECQDRGLLDSDVRLLRVVAECDATRESDSLVCKSKRGWGKAIGRDGNTAVNAMRRLARRGVLAWSVCEDGYEVLVEWQEVFRLPVRAAKKEARREQLREAICRGGEEVVRGGEAAPTCSSNKNIKLVSPVSPVSDVIRGSGERVVRPSLLPARPWSKRDGLSSEALCQAVRDRDRVILTGLYFAGIEAGFWQNSDQHRIRFLACAWQAVESAETSAMGLLTDLVKVHLGGKPRPAWLKGDGLSDAADDWAAETRRIWSKPREYLDAPRASRYEFVGADACD